LRPISSQSKNKIYSRGNINKRSSSKPETRDLSSGSNESGKDFSLPGRDGSLGKYRIKSEEPTKSAK
jgi:hypothetical protein